MPALRPAHSKQKTLPSKKEAYNKLPRDVAYIG